MQTIELNHTKSFGVIHVIPEHRRTTMSFGILDSTMQMAFEPIAIEDVVAQNECAWLACNELFSNDEGLCQTVRRRLLGV